MSHQDSDEKFHRDDAEQRRYAPKRVREQAEPTFEQPYVDPTPLFSAPQREWPPIADFNSNPRRIPDPPMRLEEESSGWITRVALFVTFAALVALLIISAKPISQFAGAFFDSYSERTDGKTNRAPVSNAASERPAPANRTSGSPEAVAVAAAGNTPVIVDPQLYPAARPQQPNVQQQAALSTPAQPFARESRPSSSLVRGVTDSEIRFGISAPFSGAAKELGQNMKLGIEAAFNAANDAGGIFGRRLRLIAADDGYEPSRTATTMKNLFEKDQVFGLVGNVGTPTAVVALPYALERKMLFFGAFTGAGLLRNDPPDRYVFNYRSSYAEETSAVVHYLVKVRHLRPNQIAVFAQQDSYGDSGFVGVAKAIRSLGGDETAILRLNYQRNTVDVDEAVEQLKKSHIPIRAVIMVPTYRAAAKFIEKTRDLYPNMIYTSVSFVGSTALANELMLLGKRFANGVIVTQVVPAIDGHSSLVLEYKFMLAKYFPGEAPDYVSFEGYVAAKVLITALKRNGPSLDTERLVATLEGIHDLDIGLGTPVSYGQSRHQGVQKVWGTQLDENGRYQPIDLQ
jgi:ABC-type branched-subunit amino acid transport system substrate-binding protein